MFDQWDHTPQNGNDTEYTFVVLAVCAGAALAIARVVLNAPASYLGQSAYLPIVLGELSRPGQAWFFLRRSDSVESSASRTPYLALSEIQTQFIARELVRFFLADELPFHLRPLPFDFEEMGSR